ncbi:HPP family protein [Pseudothioclava nitratireducens]|uniref:HPP family protein n=1 Tax=Pseudothioclava nitratireducens TaxID=1928646 RepID=UPI0023DBB024|nr:HPP family protein [Defluviimonas nitratireducens]MDF1621005.1 HPP family protein [Defluviimonas nitratireducens]
MPLSRLLTPTLRRQIGRFGPQMGRRRWIDILRAASGAGIGILITTLIVATLPHSEAAGIYLVSSFASTAVLLFVLPNSPLAQPWSALVGMMVSALVPIAVLSVVPPPWADGLAVAGAIMAMMALRALHPPAAGIALLAVLEFEADNPLDFSFALMPVAALTAVLIVFAMLWNRLFGIPYPSRPLLAGQAPGASLPGNRTPLTEDDLDKLLLEFQASANLGAADLARLVAAAEHRGAEALMQHTTVGDIMSANPISVPPEAPLSEIVRKMEATGVKNLTVTDSEGRFLGVVDQTRAMARLASDLEKLRRPFRLRAAPPEAEARALMNPDVRPVSRATPVWTLIERLSAHDARIIPVIEAGRLVGVASRRDLVRLFLEHAPKPESAPPSEPPSETASTPPTAPDP